MHQAGYELAGAGRYAGYLGYQGLAAGAAGVTARPTGYDPRPDYPLRPEWAIRWQRVQNPATRHQSLALAQPPRSYPVGRMLRQRSTGYDPGRELTVEPQNGAA